MDHGARVLNKGLKFEKIAKALFFTFLGGIGLLILVCVGICFDEASYVVKYLILSGYHAIVDVLVGVAYLAIAVGAFFVPFYFMAPVYIGLGQIAENTKK